MTNTDTSVKPNGNLANLKNVQGCALLVGRLQNRQPGLPGIGVMNGPSGYGKSYASIYAQNKTSAIRVEVGESWNKTTLMKAILRECGVPDPRGTVADLTEQAIILLGDDPRRPLFVDEADKLVAKGMIELVRELHEHSQAPVLLIGEEQLPRKLMATERVHNRVLEWFPAQPCDLEDSRKLAQIFLPNATIDDRLLDKVRQEGEGRARRIVVTLSGMAEWARNRGVAEINAKTFDGAFFTGTPPQRRVAAKPLLKSVGGVA